MAFAVDAVENQERGRNGRDQRNDRTRYDRQPVQRPRGYMDRCSVGQVLGKTDQVEADPRDQSTKARGRLAGEPQPGEPPWTTLSAPEAEEDEAERIEARAAAGLPFGKPNLCDNHGARRPFDTRLAAGQFENTQ